MFEVYVTQDWRIDEIEYHMGLESLLDEPGVNVTFLPERDYDIIRSEDLEGADAVISLEDEITEESIEGLDRLKIIARNGAGFDNVDLDACTNNGIVVVHAPQGPSASVAQGTLGLIIACAHNLKSYDQLIREHGFKKGRFLNMGFELCDKTLGIIGVGLIGSRLLRLIEPFEMEIKAYDPYFSEERAKELGISLVDLPELLKTSDIVSLHVPLTEETEGMLGEDEFKQMKESAYLINTTRGGIYSDKTLAMAIRNEWISGAAIDVFQNEPEVEGNPLLELDDVIATPHIIGVTHDSMNRIGNIISEAILQVKQNELPHNILNPDIYEEPVPENQLSPSFRS